jgi:nitronate monooxygenase
MSGRPARGIVTRLMRELGPISDVAPEFPLAAGALAPLRAKAEAQGSSDFSPLWAGQAAALGRAIPAGALTKALAAEAEALLRRLRTNEKGTP